MRYDCAIVGTGPAGLSSALNMKIHHKSFVWIGSSDLSDKLRKAETISNYPGFSNISGEALADAFKRQIQQMELEIEDHMVTSIIPFGDVYALMAGQEYYEAKTVILASGVVPAETLPGEQQFLGRGVSYCATCDGNLYRGKKLAVICNAKRFEPEVRFLAELASEVVLFAGYKTDAEFGNHVSVLRDGVKEICGDNRVRSVITGKNGEIAVDGVFCLRDAIALSALLPGLENENGHIRVNRQQETSLPGVFAAGDCTGRPYQYTKAVGEGNVAALKAISYLDALKQTAGG